MKPTLLSVRLLTAQILLASVGCLFAGAQLTEPYLWEDAAPVTEYWKHSDWYGYFSDLEYPWIWHQEHGWQWCVGPSPTSAYFWDDRLGSWIWTSNSLYPWIYNSGKTAGWLQYYHISPGGVRYFFHAGNGGYFSENELSAYPVDPSPVQLAQPVFSIAGRAFSGSQAVALSTAHPDAVIRYTLDGSIPTESSTPYQGPLVLDRTTQVRARLLVPDQPPGPVASEVYIAIDPSLVGFESGLPILLVDTFGHNIDAEVYPRGAESPWPERPVSAILIDPDDISKHASITGIPDYSGRAGMRVRGNSTQYYFPKKSYKFEIWNEDDEDLDAPLLGLPEDSDWVLYAPYTDKTLMRNALVYSLSRKMGNYASRTRYLEVFANMDGDALISDEDYLGVYVLMEKQKRHGDRIDVSRLEPTDQVEPGITGGYIVKADWGHDFKLTRTQLLMECVDPDFDELTSRQLDWIKACLDDVEAAIYANDFHHPVTGSHYTELLDPRSCIERQIIQELTKNMDGRSTFLYKDRNSPIRFGPVWDYNYAMGNVDTDWFWCRDCDGDCTSYCPEGWATFYYDPFNIGTMPWWARFKEDPDYCQYWTDRWSALRRNVLSTESILSEIDALYALLEKPAARNFERWPILNEHIRGNSYWGTEEQPHTYRDEVTWLKDWLRVRLDWLDAQLFRSPDFNQDGGLIDSDFSLEISNPNPSGVIYYTLDGTDPRNPAQWSLNGSAAPTTGDFISPRAIEYGSPIPMQDTTEIHARVRIDNQWSPLHREIFTTSRVRESLRITELHYHPTVAEAEFIELMNIGTQAIELNGVQFSDGIEFRFPMQLLLPGQAVLVVSNRAVFESVYGPGLPIAGSYSGRLSNGGESIRLEDAAGQIILQFTYADDWIPETDGDGYSLEFIDPEIADLDAWNDKGHWRASRSAGGSPGVATTPIAR